MYFVRCVCLCVFLVLLTQAERNADDWVDPRDMLRYDPMTQTMIKPEVHGQVLRADNCRNPLVSPLRSSCPSCPSNSSRNRTRNVDDRSRRCRESLFVTRYVNRLLRLFDEGDNSNGESFVVEVTLKRPDFDVFKRYVTSKGSIQDVEEVLSRMMTNVDRRSWIKNVKEALVFQEWISLLQNNMLNVACCIGVLLMLRSILKNRWYISVFELFFILFLISIAWEMQFQYQKADANKRMARHRFSEIPKECNPEKLSYWEYFFSSFNNRCQEYYEATIESHWEVNPLMAAVSVLTRTFPLFGRGMGESIVEYYDAFDDKYSFWGMLVMIPLATVILVVIIIFPCTAAVTTFITSQYVPIRHAPTRQMVEDVDTSEGQRQPLPQAPVIEQHHHHYYLQDGNGEGSVATLGDVPSVLRRRAKQLDVRIQQIECEVSSSFESLESSNEITSTDPHSANGESSQSELKCGEQFENSCDLSSSEDKIKSE